MNALLTVFLKEFVENLRDRRTVLAALIVGPIFVPLLFGLMLQFTIERGNREVDREVPVTVVNAKAAPNLIQHLRARGVVVNEISVDDAGARAQVLDRGSRMVLWLPDTIGADIEAGKPAGLKLYVDSSNSDNQRYVGRLRVLIAQYGQGIASQRLTLRGIDPLLLAPLVVQDIDVSTPASRAVLVLGMLSFFLILALMTGGMYLAIDTTVGERERGTLEPLLATATSREALMMGKMLATCSYMALSLILTTLSFFIVLSNVDLEQIGMSGNLGPMTALQVLGVTAPLIPAAAAMLTLIAAFTRSAREAQAWISVAQLVPTLPLVFASMLNLAPRFELMAVPSLSQHFLITRLLRAEPIDPVELGLSVCTTLLLGVVLVAMASRLYRREALLG
ncbi:MAG: ABC transporter permease [Steroidobacteraceae bacterium]